MNRRWKETNQWKNREGEIFLEKIRFYEFEVKIRINRQKGKANFLHENDFGIILIELLLQRMGIKMIEYIILLHGG